MDSGQYKLEESSAGKWLLSMDVTLEAYNLAAGRKDLHLDRLIQPVEDPLRNLKKYRELVDVECLSWISTGCGQFTRGLKSLW